MRAWTIEAARVEANRLRVTLDAGTDPREVERRQQADQNASKAAAAVQAVTVGEVWTVYLAARKEHWGERHHQEHGLPAGVVAQLMGHKPSATAEKHYTVRPLDLLRVHHEKIEAWILEQGGVTFDAKVVPGALRVVAG